MPYGPSKFIEKLTSHITKRLGTGLRKLIKRWKGQRLSDEKGIGGKGRLSTKRIDTFQNFYGAAIHNNKESSKEMSKATQAILKHYSSSPENPKHEDWSEGETSCCSDNRDRATGQNAHDPIKNPLPQAVVEKIQPLFDKLGSKNFLAACEKCNSECQWSILQCCLDACTICVSETKNAKYHEISKFDEKPEKKKDQRSGMHLPEMREYNINRVDSLKTSRKNNTCMWVLSGYIYSSNISTRWKFHDTAKHLNCNVVTILNTNNSINGLFVFWWCTGAASKILKNSSEEFIFREVTDKRLQSSYIFRETVCITAAFIEQPW